MCADDFNLLVKTCDGDKCLTVNADPSHCWEGEDWETRFRKVADRVYACHVKNLVIRKNVPLRKMAADWPDRAMPPGYVEGLLVYNRKLETTIDSWLQSKGSRLQARNFLSR